MSFVHKDVFLLFLADEEHFGEEEDVPESLGGEDSKGSLGRQLAKRCEVGTLKTNYM